MQQTSSWVPLFPEQASTFAWQVDALYFYLILISIGFTIPIVAVIFFFFVRYREKEKFATGEEIHGSIALETVWSIIPFVISMTIFLGGAIVYYNQYTPPADSMEVYVVGKQWMWKFQHGTGQREINELHVSDGAQRQTDDDDRRRSARCLYSGISDESRRDSGTLHDDLV